MRVPLTSHQKQCKPEDCGIVSLMCREKKTVISYMVKILFINEGEIKTFLDKQKLRKFVTNMSALQET